MPRIIVLESANRDLDEIWDYMAVENHDPVAAGQLIEELDDRLRLLVKWPKMGEAVERLRPNTRRIVVKKRFFVFYEPIRDGILVLRVLHSARLIRPDDLLG